jgi:hypothetical protein
MLQLRRVCWIALSIAFSLLTACGGGGGNDSSSSAASTPAMSSSSSSLSSSSSSSSASTSSGSSASSSSSNSSSSSTSSLAGYTVGGTISGLTGSLVLQLNGADNLTVNAAGAFTMGSTLTTGTPYKVTILTQPTDQTCATNGNTGSGVIVNNNVTSVTVTCSSNAYTIGGTVNNLSGSLVLQLNGSNPLTINASGAFMFSSMMPATSGYVVSIAVQPSMQVCTATAAVGTVASSNITNIQINCNSFSIGGTITGLDAAGLTLQLNGANDLSVTSGSTSFTFPPNTTLNGTAVYTARIRTQPTGQTCTIVNPQGLLTTNIISDINVACIDNVIDALSGTYHPEIFNGQSIPEYRAFITFYPDGTYIFGIHSDDSNCGSSNGNGIEYGVYQWNKTTHAFAIVNAVVDTNGDCGLANGTDTGGVGTLVKNSDGTITIDAADTNGSGNHNISTWAPVPSVAGTLIGSWGDNQTFIVYDGNGKVFGATSLGLVHVPSPVSPIMNDACYQLSGNTSSGSFVFDFSSSCKVNSTQTAISSAGTINTATNILNRRDFTVTVDDLQTTIAVPGGSIGPFHGSRIVTN